MAVSTVTPLPKSQPDVSKLNGFTGYMVTVTRQLGPRGVGHTVVPTQRMSKDKLLELQVSLPLKEGPGFYLFTVADEGGTGEDVWLTKLGPDIQENQMPGAPPFPVPPGPPFPGAPLDSEVKQILPGFFHNEAMGVLFTPWKRAVPWQPGQPWPEAPANATAAGHSGAPATPWQPWGQQQPGWNQPYPGWGGYPVDSSSDDKKRLEAELAEQRRMFDAAEQRRREERDRDEARRREEDRDRREEARAAEQRKMFETLAAAITAKPTGPSETELRLQRESDETKRQLEEQRREEGRRREEQLREEARRVELKAMQDKTDVLLREMKDRDRDRPDPMLAMMTTMFQSQQTTALETARLNREAADRTAAVTERHTQQLVETMRSDRSSTGETNRLMMESARDVMGMYREGAQFMIENQGGNQPWYAGAIQGALDKLGPIANAVAAARQQPQQPIQPQYAPPAVRQPPAARTVAPATTRPIPTVGAPPPATTIEANTTGDRPEGTVLTSDNTHFIVPGGPNHPGYRIPVAYVQAHGWQKTIAEIVRQNAPSPVVMPEPAASAMNGTTPNGTVGPTLTVVPPPTDSVPLAVAPTKSKKDRKKTTKTVVPPPAGRAYSGAELEALSPEQAIALVAPFDDVTLFGPLFQYVQQLRSGAPSPEETVAYIMQAQTAGVDAPAMDLLRAKQLDALVERLLPEATEEYQEAVVKLLAKKLGLEVIEEEAQA
jgi:hypothetical protein